MSTAAGSDEKPTSHRDAEKSFRIGARVLAGTVLSILLVLGLGGWAATAELAGAVIAAGSVSVDRNLKAVQHRDGGIVGEISVREGDFVKADQVLLRLDDAQTRAELSIVRSQLAELSARRARLIAERDGLTSVDFPAGLSDESPAAAIAVIGEGRLFTGNRTHRESQKQQFELQIDQIGEEIGGLEAQRKGKNDELALVETQFRKIKGLFDNGLVEAPRVYTMERELAQLLGERGEVDAGIARARTRMGEIRVQILAVDENARTEAQRELSLVVTRLSELQERRTAIEDRLSRTDIRAPISGFINELNIHTIGGVIKPAELLVTIVPEDARLKVEAKVPPVSIDQVAVGQRTRLRFSTFNQRTTPELDGRVVRVSPATSRDTATGEVYYLADVEALPGELAKLGNKTLIPGMPVEVFITTEDRTALSYIVKPFTDQFTRAFREE